LGPGVFPEYLKEATRAVTELYGDQRGAQPFFDAPVVIVAYSGGYNPAAFSLAGKVDLRCAA